MNILLMGISMFALVLQNGLFNSASKKHFKAKGDIYNYNFYTYMVCFVLFLILALTERISLFTALLAIIFGLATFSAYVFKMKAFSCGPLHISNLITTSSMIIPTMSGAILFNEKFSIGKGIAIIFLLFFIFISLQKSQGDAKFNKKWFIYCFVSFISIGAVGVLQKIHQSSIHKDELSSFLAIAFFMSMVFATIMRKKYNQSAKIEKKTLFMALTCGLCTFAMNYLNLRLSGIIPSQIFFPLVNGGAIILTSLTSCVIFKEKITKKQILGLIGGIVSLILICIL